MNQGHLLIDLGWSEPRIGAQEDRLIHELIRPAHLANDAHGLRGFLADPHENRLFEQITVK